MMEGRDPKLQVKGVVKTISEQMRGKLSYPQERLSGHSRNNFSTLFIKVGMSHGHILLSTMGTELRLISDS